MACAIARADEALDAANMINEKLKVTAADLTALRREALPLFVISGSGATHMCGNSFVDLPSAAWSTRCGWHYGDKHFRRAAEASGFAERHCIRCFRGV